MTQLEADTFRRCDNALVVLQAIGEDLGDDAVVELFKAQLTAFLAYVTIRSGDSQTAATLLAVLASQVVEFAK